jgi:hypothetical protein
LSVAKVPQGGNYKTVLNSDHVNFGRFGRGEDKMTYPTVNLYREHFLSVYPPARVFGDEEGGR